MASNVGMAVHFATEVLHCFPTPSVSNTFFDLSRPEMLQSHIRSTKIYNLASFIFSLAFRVILRSTCIFFQYMKILAS